jgi:glycosyltransferase involved in cell wall biosynthesis
VGKAWLWAADDAGCSWYRTKIVAQALRERGHDVQAGQRIGEGYEDSDAFLGQRVCTPEPSTQWARMVHAPGVRTVFDADDDYWHVDSTNEVAYRFFSEPTVRTRLMANAYAADAVTVCSDVLAMILEQYCDNVQVIPNSLPAKYLDRPRPENPKPVVGWAGTSSTVFELPIAFEALKAVPDHGGVVHTVGIPYPHLRKLGLTAPGWRHTGWVQPNEAYLDTVDFDVWAAPYRSTPYNEAKGATKALEAAFLGIPIVASPIVPYRDWVVHGVTGFLASTAQEWGEYLGLLLNDADLREQMGDAARLRAQDYTIENLAPLWESALFGEEKA